MNATRPQTADTVLKARIGHAPQQVERFGLEDHPLYAELPEAQSVQVEFDR
ncbi:MULTISPECIES: hypothetical protein [unclassified Collinsella]|uniref:hypothetical protein n=1 Tax=unclassified Collinsella TaxID=2637548 RepID=UPI003F9112AE